MTTARVIDETELMAILDAIPDPEIPVVSITDLGIVRGFAQDPPRVLISPTYSGCPATIAIENAIRDALDRHDYRDVHVERVLFPAWTTDWITQRGRERLRAYGIAPPDPATETACPRCGSLNTAEVSRFGATPCKAQWRCRDCLEPFERFKCH